MFEPLRQAELKIIQLSESGELDLETSVQLINWIVEGVERIENLLCKVDELTEDVHWWKANVMDYDGEDL